MSRKVNTFSLAVREGNYLHLAGEEIAKAAVLMSSGPQVTLGDPALGAAFFPPYQTAPGPPSSPHSSLQDQPKG